MHIHTLHKKVKDICQYLDLNTKIKTNSQHCTKHLDNFKISLTFCVVYIYVLSGYSSFTGNLLGTQTRQIYKTL